MAIFESAAARFIGARASLDGARVALFGAGYDGTASFRPGTRNGPGAIRAASDGLETYCPVLDADLEERAYADIGDADVRFGAPAPQIAAVRAAAEQLLDAGVVPFMLGGEHSLTAGPFAAVHARHPDVVLLQLDAHADLREHYLDEPNSHACVMRRCVELGAPLLQLGIRSGTADEWRWIRAHNTLTDLAGLPARLRAYAGRPLYLTVDIDVFDPSLVPGTGTPEPGGIFWPEFQAALDAIAAHDAPIVGLDLVEVSPGLDPTGVSAVVAAKCVRQMLLLTTRESL